MVVSGHLRSPASLLPGETSLGRTHLREDWVGPRAVLDVLENGDSLAPAGNRTTISGLYSL
jgi:hypothetical protein